MDSLDTQLVTLINALDGYLAQLADLVNFKLEIDFCRVLMTQFGIAFSVNQWTVIGGQTEEALGACGGDAVGVGGRVQ